MSQAKTFDNPAQFRSYDISSGQTDKVFDLTFSEPILQDALVKAYQEGEAVKVYDNNNGLDISPDGLNLKHTVNATDFNFDSDNAKVVLVYELFKLGDRFAKRNLYLVKDDYSN